MTALSYRMSPMTLDNRVSNAELSILGYIAPNPQRDTSAANYLADIPNQMGAAKQHLDNYVRSHYGDVSIKGPLYADMSKSPIPGAKHVVAAYVGEPGKGGYIFADKNIERKVLEFGNHWGLEGKAAAIYVFLHELGHAYHGKEEIKAESFVDMVTRYIAQRVDDPREKAMYLALANVARKRFDMARHIDGEKEVSTRRHKTITGVVSVDNLRAAYSAYASLARDARTPEERAAYLRLAEAVKYVTQQQSVEYSTQAVNDDREREIEEKRKKEKRKKKKKDIKGNGGKK